ncbi:unnamed protein product, partial [Rotaria magnacalcarata]
KAIDFERKAEEYMLKTEAYQEITNGRSPLSDILCAVQTSLENLVRRQILTSKQQNQIPPKLNQLELGHYHGLPAPHKPNTLLRPIIACINGPTTLVSKVLNALLPPIFLSVVRETTFINDIDVIRKLEKYVLDGLFQSTTKFIVIDVTDLYTMIPREGALRALLRFLEENSYDGKIGSLRIDSIMKLARLVLDNNCFVYNNKFYKQIRGGAMGSAFTQVLANIYMYCWEQDLIKYTTEHRGIYGRYIDDIFMATNQTAIEIQQQLKKMMNKDINIKINYEINTAVNFLDITITNENGQLKTLIYHKPTTEPYILPFTPDHPRHMHRNIPYAALMRAAHLCSNLQRDCSIQDGCLIKLGFFILPFQSKDYTEIDSLACASRNVQNQSSTTTNASERIRSSLDEQISQLVVSISNQNNEVRRSQQNVDQANINVRNAQQQVASSEKVVQDKQNGLNAAEHEMQQAQADVERARHCARRRRKRGFGGWWRKHVENPVGKVLQQNVVRPVCRVLNSVGIDNAQGKRIFAEHRLNEPRQHLHHHLQNLGNQRAQHAIAETQLRTANLQLSTLTTQLQEQQKKTYPYNITYK